MPIRLFVSFLVVVHIGLGSAPGSMAADPQRSAALAIGAAWARELPPVVSVGAAYLHIDNPGTQPVRVTGGRTRVAARVEIHTHEMDGGMLRMRHLADGVDVPAGGQLAFAPGGLHLMLIDLSQPLGAGDRFPLTLEFGDGGARTVEVEVLSMAEAAKRH